VGSETVEQQEMKYRQKRRGVHQRWSHGCEQTGLCWV